MEKTTDEMADALLKAANELEKAAKHCRISAQHFSEKEVPRGCAHAFASLGHVSSANKTLLECAKAHSLKARAEL